MRRSWTRSEDVIRVPKDHDEIIAAIDAYFDFPGAEKWARQIREVKESLLEQKERNKRLAEEKKIDWTPDGHEVPRRPGD